MGRRRGRAMAAVLSAVVLSATACGGEGTKAVSVPGRTTVATTTGTYRGMEQGAARVFLGIRYAQAPTGEHRWTLPRAAPAPRGVQQATRPGPQCAQTASAAAGAGPAVSEDCLFLNVTTPRHLRKNEKLPVMVWWHGGGYTSGAGSEYDARRLAEAGHVMVVTANYRLGVFGYLGLPGLAGSGDFGFADQLQSLRWAKGNAARFGGDPDNVTVFGQSAGAMSTCALLTSPAAHRLVDKAIIMSGSCSLKWPAGALFPGTPAQTPYTTLAADQATGVAAARQLRCGGSRPLACMRRTPAGELVGLDQEFADHLAYGTPLLPTNPADAVREGNFTKVPLISGGTRDEARSFVAGALKASPSSVTPKTYPALLRAAFGTKAAAVARTYPLTRFGGNAGLAWSTVVTDSAWACPTLRGNQALARHTQVYAYEFADPNAPDVNGVGSSSLPQQAAHATDMPYLFDLGGKNLLRTGSQRQLSRRMIDFWSSFARSGTPAAPGTRWSTAFARQGKALVLVPGHAEAVNTGAEHGCAFWGGIDSWKVPRR